MKSLGEDLPRKGPLMTISKDTRIAIIGGGPGGLTCARILQKHGIAVTVYDRDADQHARNQGGSLDLHEGDGQVALREAVSSTSSSPWRDSTGRR
jgi:glycine/D-amino acid oxidase-like deaminating enzyme